MLIVDRISKKFGEHIAIDSLSFSAKKGEVIGLVGHNGSGKSTTMKIISDCLKPDEGAVYINNVCVETSPIEAKKQIGYLPEIPPLYFDMTIEEQLKFACGLRGIPFKMHDLEIRSVCEATHISGSKKRLIGNLSKGYRQRVGLAQSLIGSPELLLLDEPTVGLDPKQMMEFRELLLSLKEKHIIIYSTHILSEISMISDRIISLSNGEITADDTLKNLKDKFSEYREYKLCADGNKEDIFTLIKGIDGVKDVLIEDDAESFYFLIKTVKNIEIYKTLFFKLASNNYPIKSFTEMNMSLEKLFMHLTEDRR